MSENHAGLSSMWRIPQLGITASDFMRQKNQNNTKAHYGSTWRFLHDQDFKREMARTKAEQESMKKARNPMETPKPLDTHLTREAEAMGQPVSRRDTASAVDQAAAESKTKAAAQAAKVVEEEAYDLAELERAVKTTFSEDQLKLLPREQLTELGASIGVANVQLPRSQLIKAILDKQN